VLNHSEPHLSVVIPFYNEEENVEKVCREVAMVLDATIPGRWELLMVNDGSKDRTSIFMNELAEERPAFRALHLVPNSGQTAALEAGFRGAKGTFIGTLDGDGQNDPADLLPLLAQLRRRRVHMMCGIRTNRADNFVRRLSSKIANRLRARALHDNISDVGCSMRVFRRAILTNVGFFRNAHRFFPALIQLRGFRVAEMPVGHRARHKGTSKYGGGIRSRLWVGIADLLGVYWLRKRALSYKVKEFPPT